MIFTYILIILTALYGLFITNKIRVDKKKPAPMVCPMGGHCDIVVKSKFSTFLGIGLEKFGILYYITTIIAYSLYLLSFVIDFSIPLWYIFIIYGLSIGAFLFSLYLTFVQAFYIKSWCTWCLCSATASTLIFLFATYALTSSGLSLIPIFEMFHKPILMIHLLGFALGVGGATITDVLFYRFLKDFKITKEEDNILRIMSQVIWFGLFLSILSGIGLYLPEVAELNESSKFLVKAVIVGIITINGAFLNLFISPKLIDMSFRNDDKMKNIVHVKNTDRLRKTAFALGAVSLVSWYSAFILGVLDSVPLPFISLLSLYIIIVAIAVIISQIAERIFTRRK